MFDDHYFMQQALIEAKKASEEGEIPVGAVVVCEGKMIARAHNQTERLKDVTAHAEMLAITSATSYLSAKYLDRCTIYVTLEPCVMCAGALFWSQIDRVVYGARDEKRGFSRLSSFADVARLADVARPILHPKTEFYELGGELGKECGEMVKRFFAQRRSVRPNRG